MSESQPKPPQRVWKCAACAKTVQAVRNAAGAIVCAECGKPVTPELAVPTTAVAAGMPTPQPKAVPKPVAAQAMARRPQRPGTTAVKSAAQQPKPSARPGTPAEALASSGAWVPDPNPLPSPNLAKGENGPPEIIAPPAATRSKGPLFAGVVVLILALVGVAIVIVIKQKSPTAQTAAGGTASQGTPQISPPDGTGTAAGKPGDTGAPTDSATKPAETTTDDAKPVRRVVDLLSIVDLARDTAAGKWHLVPGGISSDDSRFARVSLPYEPPEEYDFRIEFTRASANNESLVQLIRDNGHDCSWVLNGWKGQACAFNMVAGKTGPDNAASVHGIELRSGERHTSIVKVRKDYIEAWLDDKMIVHYDTDGTDLTRGKDWNLGRKSLGVGSNLSPTVFHAILVAEVTGQGRIVTSALPPMPPPSSQPAKGK